MPVNLWTASRHLPTPRSFARSPPCPWTRRRRRASVRSQPAGGWDAYALVANRDEFLGALAITKPAGSTVPEADRRVLRQLAAQAGTVFESLWLHTELARSAEALSQQAEELRRSRQRLVQAQDLERRRSGRDLHGGAQQDLVPIIGKAMLARSQLARDARLADATLQELQPDVRSALEEVRNLAAGVFPPLPADDGLVAAVEARAGRSTVPVAVEADDLGVARFDPPSREPHTSWFRRLWPTSSSMPTPGGRRCACTPMASC
jgi:signal transduction histidine kinase